VVTKSNLLLAVLVAAAPLLGGCGTSPTATVPETVDRQVPVPCIPLDGRPPRPVLRTPEELMAMERGPRTLAAWSELEKLWGYAPQLEALVDGCGRLPRAPP